MQHAIKKAGPADSHTTLAAKKTSQNHACPPRPAAPLPHSFLSSSQPHPSPGSPPSQAADHTPARLLPGCVPSSGRQYLARLFFTRVLSGRAWRQLSSHVLCKHDVNRVSLGFEVESEGDSCRFPGAVAGIRVCGSDRGGTCLFGVWLSRWIVRNWIHSMMVIV